METNKFYPMTQLPPKVSEEEFSETVLVYDEDLEDFDLGYYNFDTKQWSVFGCLSMKLICWSRVPAPKINNDWEIVLHEGYVN